MGWMVYARPRRLYTRETFRYPSYRRLTGPQGRSGRVSKIFAPFGIFFCSLFVLYPYFFVLTFLYFASCPYCTTHTTQKPMHPVEFKTAVPVSDVPQTLALERSPTGIGGIRSPNHPVRSELL